MYGYHNSGCQMKYSYILAVLVLVLFMLNCE